MPGFFVFENKVYICIVMETKSKYYTPALEEFHIGFEFETFSLNGTWKKNVFETNTFISSINTNNGGERPFEAGLHWIYDEAPLIRVKHLDREDIESLGFAKSFKDEWIGWHDYFIEVKGTVDYYLKATLHKPRHAEDLNNVTDNNWRIMLHRCYESNESETTSIEQSDKMGESLEVFRGLIKNKSELKRLMVQLGIV